MTKILLVDDDSFISDIYTDKLKEEKFEVELAVDGEEALKKISELKPDLILLDILMPKMDGFEVLKKIKKDPVLSQIKVIILTNVNQKDEAEKGSTFGVDDYVIKANFTPSVVMNKIKQVLNKQRNSG